MGLSQLFNYSVAPSGSDRGAVASGAAPTVSAFLTTQSLVSFPVASMLVTLLWKILQRLAPPWADSEWTAMVISLLVGAFVYLASTSDPALAQKPQTTGQRLVTGFIAFVNSMYLFAAAVGLATAASP